MYVDQNLSINQIIKILPYGLKLVRSVLNRNGIEIKLGLKKYKPTQEELNLIKRLVDNKESYHTIVKAIGKDFATVKRIIQENNLNYNYKPYNKNLKEDFFSNIDSSEKAWLLGFLYTDGSVRQKKNNYQIRLMIQIKDEPIIDRIISLLNIKNGKRYDLRKNKECVGFEFSSKQIFNDLGNYGIIPNKTFTNQHLFIEKIPEQFKRDYVRGLFDGDGGICFTGDLWETTLNFTAHFCSEVEEFQLYIDQ